MERVISRGRKRCIKEGYVRVSKNCEVVAKNRTKVNAQDRAKVTALDYSIVNAYDNSFIQAYNNSQIFVFGSPTIIVKDPGVVIVHGFGKPKVIWDLAHARNTINGSFAKVRSASVGKTGARCGNKSGKGNLPAKSSRNIAKAGVGNRCKRASKANKALRVAG